jgi:hypothetical protein
LEKGNIMGKQEMTLEGSPVAKRLRRFTIGVLAAAALAVPAVSTMGAAGHEAGKSAKTTVVSHDSHRLALGGTGFAPASVRVS